MSDQINRAAATLEEHPGPTAYDDDGRNALRQARALDAAGLLVTPAHDAEVAAKALRDAADRFADGLTAANVRQYLRDRAGRIEREGGGDV